MGALPIYPQGWFSNADMREYRRLVNTIPSGGTLVEVGVWIGRSLCSIADVVRSRQIQVIAVDSFTKKRAMGYEQPTGGQMVALLNNLKAFGMVADIRAMRSLDAVQTVTHADLVFLDADHRYASVLAEIAAWRTKTPLIGGHDYGNPIEPGVKPAVDKTFPRGVTVHGQVWSASTR